MGKIPHAVECDLPHSLLQVWAPSAHDNHITPFLCYSEWLKDSDIGICSMLPINFITSNFIVLHVRFWRDFPNIQSYYLQIMIIVPHLISLFLIALPSTSKTVFTSE